MVEALHVRTVLRNAKPQVPIDVIRHDINLVRTTRGAATPRLADPEMRFVHLADHAATQRRNRCAVGTVTVDLRTHLRDDASLRRQIRHLAALIQIVRDRLLTIDVLAKTHRGQRNRTMHMVGCRDNDGIDVLAHRVEHLAIVRERLGACILLGRVAKVVGVDVAQRGDVHVLAAGGRVEIAAPHTANADACDVQRFQRA